MKIYIKITIAPTCFSVITMAGKQRNNVLQKIRRWYFNYFDRNKTDGKTIL